MALARALVGVDPGATTGACVLLLEDDTYRLGGAYQFTDQDNAWQEIDKLLTTWRARGYEVHLVMEQFDKRPGVIAPDFSAKYVERDIDNNVTAYDHKHKQIPAEAKNLIKEAKNNRGTGDALRRFGLYQTGLKHSNDSLRHAVTYAVVQLKYMPLILKGWPKPID